MSREAMQMALEDLLIIWNDSRPSVSALRAALAEQPAAPAVQDDAAWRLEQLKRQWADGRSGSLGAAQAYINGLECSLAAAIPPGCVVVPVGEVELRKDAERYRGMRHRAIHGPHEAFHGEYGWFDVSAQHEVGFDVTVDAMLAARPGGKG